jgi:hypothetical protein
MSQSPFQKYFDTNYVPSAEELRTIRDLCVEPLREIRWLDEEIKRLNAKRQELKTFVDAHKKLLSPIRQLSPEVLQRIFVACNHTSPYFSPMLASESPLLLGRVCKGWREIAYNTAELWTAIHVAVPHPEFGADDAELNALRLEAMKEWLGRAGGMNLHISIYVRSKFSSSHAPEQYNVIAPYMDALVPLSNRWQSLRISFPFCWLSQFPVQGPALPALRDFTYSHIDADEWTWTTLQQQGHAHAAMTTPSFLSEAPLTSLSLTSTGNGRCGMPHFRKDSLIHLTITASSSYLNSAPQLVAFLAECGNLKSLCFAFYRDPESLTNPTPGPQLSPSITYDDDNRVTLPLLEYLHLLGSGTDQCSVLDFWNRLKLPRLKTLVFATPRCASGHQDFARFMNHSPCSTVKIHVVPDHIRLDTGGLRPIPVSQWPDAIKYLDACSSVTDLSLHRETLYETSVPSGESLLYSIFLSDSQNPRLPKLKTLTLMGYFSTFPKEFLMQILEKRASMSHRDLDRYEALKKLNLTVQLPPPTKKQLEPSPDDLHEFEAYGTNVVVRTVHSRYPSGRRGTSAMQGIHDQIYIHP